MFKRVGVYSFLPLLLLSVGGCSKQTGRVELSAASQRNEQALKSLSEEVATLRAELNKREAKAINALEPRALPEAPKSSKVVNPLEPGAPQCSTLAETTVVTATGDRELDSLRSRIALLERKLHAKRTLNNLESANVRLLSDEMRGHTSLYSLKGEYRVMVIPVEFNDVKFRDPGFIREQAQDYLFGDNPNSLTNYYRHASLGKLKVSGEVTPIITVDGNLVDYGEAITNQSDKAARELVVQALAKLKEMRGDAAWWESFDGWDLNDYDLDNNRREPDGFIDAVVLINAGKPQSSCQASFDPERERPASADVPPGPRHDAAVECFNRIWPHRWAIALAEDDPRYSKVGPEVEGIVRPSMNGYKITDHLFALDYNMQSEYSDLATFIHEFGHSLTLPDVYDSRGPGNSTGEWEAMSGTAHLQAQEMSTYSKISLGWVEPKIVKKGQTTTAYLGTYNYVSATQRDANGDYDGPEKVLENFDDAAHSYDVVSVTPGFGESVYRSVVALMGPTVEVRTVVETPPAMGTYAVYTDRFDGDSRSVKVKLRVPAEGDATLRFDEIHHIETETNFDSKEPEIKVTVDYDIGQVLVNGEVRDTLRLMSGDTNDDTLVDADPTCPVARVLELRTIGIGRELTEAEAAEFKEKVAACRKPQWVKRAYNLEAFRGQEVEVEIRYVTDGGYTEFGIVADNFELGQHKVDFESGLASLAGQWKMIKEGKIDVLFNQFYMFEYRDPAETFASPAGERLSYNMDNNIVPGTQAMFEPGEGSLLDRFRMFTIDYQPGVLVWYFNSKFDRRANSPTLQAGKGYLLVLNSKVQEMKFPGVMSSPSLFNAKGEYDTEAESFKAFVNEQTRLFKCFGAIGYYTYVDGEAPNCADVPAELHEGMKRLKFGEKSLVERREGFNDFLPTAQYAMRGVGVPMRNFASMRTALSTFRPASEQPARPIKVYKAVDGKMVVDERLTSESVTYPPVASFRDRDSVLPENPRFHGDTVVVEPKGFGFEVAAPSPRVVNSYSREADADANENFHRRPRAKLIFRWE